MKILLAVDGSECSLAAVEGAARLPWPEGSVARIVSVAELSLPAAEWTLPAEDGSYEEFERIIEERRDANLGQAMARFYEFTVSSIEVTSKGLRGDPKSVILEEAEHWKADLIVLGTHGYNAFERLWLGSVSRAVASYAKCTVEIVRQRKDREKHGGAIKILLAVDGSEFSEAAVEHVANRPWPPGSEVHVACALHLPFTPTPETWSLPDSYYSQLEKVEREQADATIKRAVSRLQQSDSERETPLKITTEVITGHPGQVINETAKTWGADMVVVGSHGRRGLKRFLLGSVSQSVADHAPCSVVIVRQQTPSEEGKTQ